MGLAGVAITVALLLVFGFLIPNIRVKAREAETRQNLHSIQLAAERYSVDMPGYTYPAWLLGGELSSLDGLQADPTMVADPLQSEGYMPQYPRNPFVAKSPDRQRIASLQEMADDPFRPGSQHPAPPAFRFGNNHDRMGVLLSNHELMSLPVANDENSAQRVLQTGVDVVFPETQDAKAATDGQWLCGQFVYFPSRISSNYYGMETDEQLEWRLAQYEKPGYPGSYFLGAFGAARGNSASADNCPGQCLPEFMTEYDLPWENRQLIIVLGSGCSKTSYSEEMQRQFEKDTGIKYRPAYMDDLLKGRQ